MQFFALRHSILSWGSNATKIFYVKEMLNIICLNYELGGGSMGSGPISFNEAAALARASSLSFPSMAECLGIQVMSIIFDVV